MCYSYDLQTTNEQMCAKRKYEQDVAAFTIKHCNVAGALFVKFTICRFKELLQSRPLLKLCAAIVFCFAGVNKADVRKCEKMFSNTQKCCGFKLRGSFMCKSYDFQAINE